MWLVIVGVVVQLLGSLLTILYRHPALGHSLILESYNARANKVGGTIGIALVPVGAGLAIAGAITQSCWSCS